MKADRAALLEQAKTVKWWHAIDFGDAQSVGRDPADRQNGSLYGVMDLMKHVDLTGLDCLDIGATDGLVAFHMKARGARRVVATDRTPKPREGFALARQLLDLDVEFLGNTDFETIIDSLGEHRFDVIVCAGVMYHMLHPFDAVLKCRRLLKRNGVLFMQTFADLQEKRPVLWLNSMTKHTRELNTFWTPSASAVDGMLWQGGFEVLATRSVVLPTFHAAVCRNARLEELSAAPGMIYQQHMEAARMREMVYGLPDEASSAVYTGPRDHADIVATEYEPDFLFQPKRGGVGVGGSVAKTFG